MSARLFEIYAVLGQQKAVRGAQDTSEAAFSFVEGDTYRLRLNAQRPVSEPGSTQRYTPATFSEFVTFEAALGQVDAAPEGNVDDARASYARMLYSFGRDRIDLLDGLLQPLRTEQFSGVGQQLIRFFQRRGEGER